MLLRVVTAYSPRLWSNTSDPTMEDRGDSDACARLYRIHLLMLVTVYQAHWVKATAESIRLDPTRMAQGIMTGIGFLGAGVIMKDGLSVRGLTTAASIWITAAIGI